MAARALKISGTKGLEVSIDGNSLTIKILDITKTLGPSKSGKTEIIATMSGNKAIPGHENVKLGLNCYTDGE